MELKIIGSSSAGNCYLLENDHEALLLETGVRFSDVKKVIGFDVAKIFGCLITHSHLDHCKYTKEVLAAGINCYTSQGTIVETGINHHRLIPVKAGVKFCFCGFSILPFNVKHDTAEPLGFLIHHRECGTVLFMTDTYYVEYRFANLNHILVECNYSEEILNDNLENWRINSVVKNRVIQSHMELKTLLQMLSANNLSAVRSIVLLHLSDSNSNAEQFRRTVENHTSKSVYVADKGSVINLDITPF